MIQKKRSKFLSKKPKATENELQSIEDELQRANESKLKHLKSKYTQKRMRTRLSTFVNKSNLNDKSEKSANYKLNIIPDPSTKQLNSLINTNYNSSNLNSDKSCDSKKDKKEKLNFKEIIQNNKKLLEKCKKQQKDSVIEKEKSSREIIDLSNSNRIFTKNNNTEKELLGSSEKIDDYRANKINKNNEKIDNKKLFSNNKMIINQEGKFNFPNNDSNIQGNPDLMETEKMNILHKNSGFSLKSRFTNNNQSLLNSNDEKKHSVKNLRHDIINNINLDNININKKITNSVIKVESKDAFQNKKKINISKYQKFRKTFEND